MSGFELLVIAFGLFIGYWLVSRMLGGHSHRSQRHGASEHTDRAPPQQTAEKAWHQVLEVPPDASAAEIKRAYQSLIRQYHPDKVAALGEELQVLSERKTMEINIAYDRAMRARGEAA